MPAKYDRYAQLAFYTTGTIVFVLVILDALHIPL